MGGNAESGVWRPGHGGRPPGQTEGRDLSRDAYGYVPNIPGRPFRGPGDKGFGFGPAAPEESDALDYAALLRKLWNRKFLFITIAVLATGLATAVILQLTPHYVAHALVVIGDSSEMNRPSQNAAPVLPPDMGAVQTAVEILHSPQLAAEVVRALSLEENPEFNPAIADRDTTSVMAQARTMISRVKTAILGAPSSFDSGADPAAALSQTVRGFLSHLRVSIRNNSRVIDVAFDSRDAQLAMRVANALVDHYVGRQLELRSQSARRSSDWLRERIAQLDAKVADAERAVEEFRSNNGLFSMPGGSPLLLKQMTDVSAELATAETERAAIEARLRQNRASLDAVGRNRVAGDIIDSPLMETLQTEEAKVQQQLAEMSSEYGDKYPLAVGLREKLRNIHAAMRRESLRVMASIDNDLQIARMKEQDLKLRLSRLKDDVSRMNGADVALRALERTAQADRRVLDDFMTRLTTTTQNADISWQKPDAQIASYAQVPVLPERPRKGLLILVSGIASLIGSAFVVLLVERSDRSIRSLQEIEAQLGMAGLGMLPMSESARLSPSQAARYGSAYREALKATYTSLFSTPDAPRVTLITSAIPGEGKTTLALGLSAMAAQCGNRVLLLDADFWKRGSSEALGIHGGVGLAEVLERKVALNEVIISDVVSGADIMLPGRFSRGSLLAWTRRLHELVDLLKDQYDAVIIDAAPVLSASEAVLLAQYADATVMAVRWGNTPRDATAAAARKLRRAGAFLAGSVLTMVDERQHASYGYAEATYFSGEFENYQSSPTGAITWSSSSEDFGQHLPDKIRQNGGTARRHALLVVDVEETPGLSRAGHSRSKVASGRLKETINSISDIAARSGVTVIYTYRASGHADTAALSQQTNRTSDSHAGTSGTDARLRRVSEHIFPKHNPDAFSNPQLNKFLRENGIEHLFIAGMDGVTSIKQTARSALAHGYLVTFIQDGIFTSSENKWKRLLKLFESMAAFAITKDEFVEFCERLSRTAQRKPIAVQR